MGEEDIMYSKYAKLRDKRGYKNSDVSKATGIPYSCLSDWKAGRSKPKADKLSKIAALLQCKIEDLL
jgi:DNA-binding Xre family transcriptional regulator